MPGIGFENSISCQDFSCYQQNRNSYLSKYVGQQFLISAHNSSLASSTGNHLASEGMDVWLNPPTCVNQGVSKGRNSKSPNIILPLIFDGCEV